MFKHILNSVWALLIIGELSEIKIINRWLLWRKSLRLYLSFLAFTDVNRPQLQLRRTMICAVVSAIYDYDTDWVKTSSPDTSIFFRLLDSLLKDHSERKEIIRQTRNLFRLDWQNCLSVDGLERGSVALTVYRLIIGSRWLSIYSQGDINLFGRKLQIVDDLLDLEKDKQAGDTNCLLTSNKDAFIQELSAFFESDFFGKLKKNSRIYRKLHSLCLEKLNGPPLWKGLLATSHKKPGPYAAVLTLIGFGFYAMAWVPALLSALSYLGITMSIMSFNDYIDRFHDRKKGKFFASEHTEELSIYLYFLCGITSFLLSGLALFSYQTAIFCLTVWIFGLLYSYARRMLLFQNCIVAACSASPILAGMVYHGYLLLKPSVIFVSLFFLILRKEIYLDTKDSQIDEGYKATLPVRNGNIMTAFDTIPMVYAWSIPLLLYPSRWVQVPVFLAAAVSQAMHGLLFSGALTGKQRAQACVNMTDAVIALLLVCAFITERIGW